MLGAQQVSAKRLDDEVLEYSQNCSLQIVAVSFFIIRYTHDSRIIRMNNWLGLCNLSTIM